MNLYILQQYKFINDLYKDESFIDILINIDDFFDILNIYSYPNWLDAEVVDMKCMKYFTSITLKTPYDKMPHPKGAVVLTKYDNQVKYRESYEYLPVEVNDVDDTFIDRKTGERRPKVKKVKCWLVDCLIKNKHIINDEVFDLQAMQDKVKEQDDNSDELENVVNNNSDTVEGE